MLRRTIFRFNQKIRFTNSHRSQCRWLFCFQQKKDKNDFRLRLAESLLTRNFSAMKLRFVTSILAIALLAACPSSDSKKKKAKSKSEHPAQQIKDQNAEISFQSFVGLLRTAVAKRDTGMLSSMMTSDFGYCWQTPPPGMDVFGYWDKENSWSELQSVLGNQWMPHEQFMVASNEKGYRAGVRQINGSWRFAYFVPAPPQDEPTVSTDITGLPPLPNE
jgi:hypothetical protein